VATGELAAEAIEEVAVNLEEAAVAVRRFDAKVIGFFLLGVGIGAGIGFFIGYRYNREKLRAEAFRESEEELEKIREVYRAGRMVEKPKPDVEEIVEEKGYKPAPSYPDASVEPMERPLPPPVPVHEPEPEKFRVVRTEEAEKDKDTGWSYPYELSQRRPNVPFIIHQDEFFGEESGFQHVTYTYYAGDDVLADEDETVLNNRTTLIGPEEHLTRFGHGSDDFNLLYIRNTHLELEIEIVRVPGSYEQEIQGLEDETISGNNDAGSS
jgi:hypothetical protein